jgi:hypothetical protein
MYGTNTQGVRKMTKEEVLKALDDAFIDYEIVGEHTDSFHILVKAEEEDEEEV